MWSEAAYPPGHGDEPLANGRTAQRVADTENQRGAEQSHGMPFCRSAVAMRRTRGSALAVVGGLRRGVTIGIDLVIGVFDVELLAAQLGGQRLSAFDDVADQPNPFHRHRCR